MTVPDTISGGRPGTGDDADCWREAARLRREYRGWVIIWLAPAREYRAYRRLPGARRDTALAASTPGDLAALISQAERAVRTPPAPRGPAVPDRAAGPAGDSARRMRAIGVELTAAGLTARMHDTRLVLDVTATLQRPGCKETEVVVDDDLYVEIRYWNPPDATPAEVTAVIVRALAAITTAQRTLAAPARPAARSPRAKAARPGDRPGPRPARPRPPAGRHRRHPAEDEPGGARASGGQQVLAPWRSLSLPCFRAGSSAAVLKLPAPRNCLLEALVEPNGCGIGEQLAEPVARSL